MEWINGKSTYTISTSDNRLKTKCPHCAEATLADAIVCRFCGRDVAQTSISIKQQQEKQELQKSLVRYEKKGIDYAVVYGS